MFDIRISLFDGFKQQMDCFCVDEKIKLDFLKLMFPTESPFDLHPLTFGRPRGGTCSKYGWCDSTSARNPEIAD